jgi:hypothetical protein
MWPDRCHSERSEESAFMALAEADSSAGKCTGLGKTGIVNNYMGRHTNFSRNAFRVCLSPAARSRAWRGNRASWASGTLTRRNNVI